VLATGQVLDAQAPSSDHIINSVEIRASPRRKQSSANIYTLAAPIQINPGVNEVWINFDNPVLAANTPSYTANTDSGGGGSDISAQVFLTRTDSFAQAIKYTLRNDSGTVGFITALTITGRVATIAENIYWREVDSSSLTAYEERPLVIENNYIQSLDWAKSYARLLLDDFSDPERLQTITIRAIPELRMGDLISWQGRYWRVFGIRTTLDASVGFVQELDILQRDIVTYFRIGVSLIGGADGIAP
jgi:hypothetical protein